MNCVFRVLKTRSPNRCQITICASLTLLVAATTGHADLWQDFNGGGNTPYHFSKSDPGNTAPVEVTEDSNTFVRIADSDGDNNSLAFDENSSVTGPAPQGKVFQFDFRLSGDVSAEGYMGGLGAGYAAAGPWGTTGPRNPGVADTDTDWEQPGFPGAAMLGFKPSENSISLNAFEILLNEATAPFSLNNGVFNRSILTVTPDPADATKALFDLDLIEDVQGAATMHSVMTDVPANINLSGLPQNRVMAGARSVGAALTADVDNFHVYFLPEPSSVVLIACAALGLLPMCRRRESVASA